MTRWRTGLSVSSTAVRLALELDDYVEKALASLG
jgi:hypothetical protein